MKFKEQFIFYTNAKGKYKINNNHDIINRKSFYSCYSGIYYLAVDYSGIDYLAVDYSAMDYFVDLFVHLE